MADIEVAYDPITVNSGPVTVAVNGLDNIKLSVPDPIKTETTLKLPDTFKSDGKTDIKSDGTFAFTIPEPVRTDAKADVQAGIDIRPLVLDQCLRLSLGPLPATRICLPSRQRFGFSLFGMEILGILFEGEAKILVGEPERQTHVVQRPPAAHKAAGEGMRIRLGERP